jgi:hypothetical protein
MKFFKPVLLAVVFTLQMVGAVASYETVSTTMTVEAIITAPAAALSTCSISTHSPDAGGALVSCDQASPYTVYQMDPSSVQDSNTTVIQVSF